MREDSNPLSMPLVFSPVYSMLAANLTKNANVMSMAEFPSAAADNVSSQTFGADSQYDAWGHG